TINNGTLGMVRQWQDMVYGERHSHSYVESVPDFVKLAEAYHHVGLRVEKIEDLESTLEKAMAMKDRLVFVDIIVDQSEHVYPMQVKGGAMDELWISKGVKV
ncbi:MAG: acetolactate synthase-1/2/3 large subunit, partial [Enterobacterales bacterium]